MKIGLVDVDSHNFPNLSLMKISAYHKKCGDDVEWAIGYIPYDKVYKAKVFSFTQDDETAYQANVIEGGTGYNVTTRLPEEIEHTYPDYSLYGIRDTAYGYLTRGCPRGCGFCIVGEKEGKISQKVSDLAEFWDGQKKIVLLDPNILACNEWETLFADLATSKAEVDFTQGLDIRLMNDEKMRAVNNVKYKKLHFAWDNTSDETTLRKLKEYANAWKVRCDKLMVYVLTNFNSTHEEDVFRVEKLREIGYTPYVMIFDKNKAPKKTRELQRYANNKIIFYSCKSFGEYRARSGVDE